MSQKTLQLEMTFPSPNECVRSFNRFFCGWGIRKTPYDINGNIKGGTAPLWANPSRTFFLIFFILNFICSILFIASYIVVQYYSNQHKDDGNCQQAKGNFKTAFIVIGSIILFVNSLYWLYIYLKEYASDQEWSRYMIILLVFWLAMVGFLIAEYIISVDNLSFYNDNKTLFEGDENKSCRHVYIANLSLNFVVSIFNTIIAIIMGVKVVFISKGLFFTKYVPHTATSEDEDIIIMV